MNRAINNIVVEFQQTNLIKTEVIEQVLQIENVMNINTGGSFSQDSASKTQSIPHQKNP